MSDGSPSATSNWDARAAASAGSAVDVTSRSGSDAASMRPRYSLARRDRISRVWDIRGIDGGMLTRASRRTPRRSACLYSLFRFGVFLACTGSRTYDTEVKTAVAERPSQRL